MYWQTLSGRTKLKLTVRQGNRPEAIVKALSFINVFNTKVFVERVSDQI